MRPLRSTAPVWIAVLPWVGLVAGWWAAPETTARWAAKEGLVEHVSHAVLAAALVGWIVRGTRSTPSLTPRLVPVGVALWCAVVLAEELDWGAVYGLRGIAEVLIGAVGRPDLHNAWGGASYLVFGVPIVGLIALGWLGRGDMTRSDAAGLTVIVAASLIGTLASEGLEPRLEPLLDEVGELSLYGVLAWIGWRPTTTARTPPDTDDPRPCSA